MNTLKSTRTLIFTIAAAVAILGTVMISMQTVSAPRTCGSCVEFKKLTHEFEKNVIGDPNISQGPQPHLRELLDAYDQKVIQLFFTDPWLNQVRTLLQSYEQDVTTIFGSQPPEPEKQTHHDQIKEFKQLTKDFEGAVAAAIIAATQDNY